MEFCHALQKGRYGTAAYRAAYGQDRSRSPRKAAAKIKAGRAVREYLAARYEELCIRDRIAREADMKAITESRNGFDKAAYIASGLQEALQQQSSVATARRIRTPLDRLFSEAGNCEKFSALEGEIP